MKNQTVKSYLNERKDKKYKPFIIELEEGEYTEIPSSHNLPNDYQFAFAKYNLKAQEVFKSKNDNSKIKAMEDIYHLTNETLEVFREIDKKYGSTLWWMIFKDWAQFCSEQLEVSDPGK